MATQNTIQKRTLGLSAYVLVPLTLSGCIAGDQKQFYGLQSATPGASPSGGAVATATPTPNQCQIQTTTQNLRILFMIDNSGSTAKTDPVQAVRVETIKTFLQTYSSHTNLTYSFSYFSNASATEFDMTSSQFTHAATNPFGDAAGLSAALSAYQKVAPSGSTPYDAAFTALQTEIAKDESAGNKQNYVVVFMSDGMPTDLNGNIIIDITGLVTGAKSTASQNGSLLTVSSVYFGPENDSASINNLQDMASVGHGQFLDSNQIGTLSIQDIIKVPGPGCS